MSLCFQKKIIKKKRKNIDSIFYFYFDDNDESFQEFHENRCEDPYCYGIFISVIIVGYVPFLSHFFISGR